MRRHINQQYLDLAIATRRFSAMCSTGVRLSDMLGRLASDGESYGGQRWQVLLSCMGADSNMTLTRALASLPEHFPPIYVTMVRVGEISGVLDEALGHLADLLEEDVRFSRLLGRPSGLLVPPHERNAQKLGLLAAPARAATLSLFCRCFGLMLTSGVPIMQAMEVSADILPPVERTRWLETRERLREGGHCYACEFLPPFVQEMMRIGEETGSLGHVMLDAADVFRGEVECRMWGSEGGSLIG